MSGEESGNEKIVKFMNMKVEDYKPWWKFGRKIRVVMIRGYSYPVKDIPYLHSWDWLNIIISSVRTMNTIHKDFFDLSLLDKAILAQDIEAAYIEVIQFINAYNTIEHHEYVQQWRTY